jgi:hypothetical protein
METVHRGKIFERFGKLSELECSFDTTFWQSQSSKARMDAAWELVGHALRLEGKDVHQLRLQRSVENFQRQ